MSTFPTRTEDHTERPEKPILNPQEVGVMVLLAEAACKHRDVESAQKQLSRINDVLTDRIGLPFSSFSAEYSLHWHALQFAQAQLQNMLAAENDTDSDAETRELITLLGLDGLIFAAQNTVKHRAVALAPDQLDRINRVLSGEITILAANWNSIILERLPALNTLQIELRKLIADSQKR